MYHVFGEKYHDFREGICKNLVFLLHKRIEEAEIPRLGHSYPLAWALNAHRLGTHPNKPCRMRYIATQMRK